MRITAARCCADPTLSAHLLEKYEREYVTRVANNLFPANIKIASNVEFRELPEWAEKKNKDLQSQGNGLDFGAK